MSPGPVDRFRLTRSAIQFQESDILPCFLNPRDEAKIKKNKFSCVTPDF